jgi:uncharacterized protein YceK
MVQIIVLILFLTGCSTVSKDTPKMGVEVDAPDGWKYTYCPSHQNEIGCKVKSPN